MAVLEGEGIHTTRGNGNQCVKMKIVIPSLSAEEKSALTEILVAKMEAHKPDAELEPLKEALRW
jgi:DnaJ-class molecular chaperone